MKAQKLRDQSTEELHQLLEQELREQFNLRMQKGSGQEPKMTEFPKLRRNIARIKTILRERSMNAVQGS